MAIAGFLHVIKVNPSTVGFEFGILSDMAEHIAKIEVKCKSFVDKIMKTTQRS